MEIYPAPAAMCPPIGQRSALRQARIGGFRVADAAGLVDLVAAKADVCGGGNVVAARNVPSWPDGVGIASASHSARMKTTEAVTRASRLVPFVSH